MPDLTARAETALKKLIARDGSGLYTSNGLLFNHTIFGRDVSMISRWLLELGPDYRTTVREVVLELSRLQGLRYRGISEEEPGRILNEYKEYAKWQAPWWLKNANRAIGLVWGGTWQHELGYVGLDSTPLYILLVTEIAHEDRSILDAMVTRRDGTKVLVRQCLLEAIRWVMDHRERHGFVASRRRNPISLFFQSWRDSHLAYLYPNGQLASLSRPVVYLEVQANAIDALRAASALLGRDLPTDANAWRSSADALAALTLERFWLEDRSSFAVALDPNNNGHLVPVPTPGSSSGWLLGSTIFDHQPAASVQKWISAIVRQLGSSEFMTPVGVRARGNGSDAGLGVADYHGSWTAWPVDTYMLARGLRRQGLPELAAEYESRLTAAVERAGSFYEFFLVSPAGEVLWRPHEKPAVKPVRRINIQILPERDLGWTITACLMIGRQSIKAVAHERWRTTLQHEVLGHLRRQSPHTQTDAPFGVRNKRGALRVTRKALSALAREYIFHK